MSRPPAPRGSRPGGLHLSPSGYERFATCEQRWLYAREQTEPELPSNAMRLGSLMHRLVQAWWRGIAWELELIDALEEDPIWKPGYEQPPVFTKAAGLMAGYEAQYEAERDTGVWTPEAIELPFELPLALGVGLHGYLDGLFRRDDGSLWVWELKTMSQWRRMDRIAYEVQPQTYLYAAREMGYPVVGVLWDAVSTYDYKGGITEQCFRRIELGYDQALVDWTMNNYERAARRVKQIVRDPSLAVRNVGEACGQYGGCPARATCHPVTL